MRSAWQPETLSERFDRWEREEREERAEEHRASERRRTELDAQYEEEREEQARYIAERDHRDAMDAEMRAAEDIAYGLIAFFEWVATDAFGSGGGRWTVNCPRCGSATSKGGPDYARESMCNCGWRGMAPEDRAARDAFLNRIDAENAAGRSIGDRKCPCGGDYWVRIGGRVECRACEEGMATL